MDKHKKKSQPEKNQEPAFHPLFVNPKKVEFENVFFRYCAGNNSFF